MIVYPGNKTSINNVFRQPPCQNNWIWKGMGDYRFWWHRLEDLVFLKVWHTKPTRRHSNAGL